jgi:hypothetical protein
MSRTNWSKYGIKRLDFSFKGIGKSEYLVAAVLGLVIIGAAYGIYRGIAGPSQPKGPDWFMYKCEKCGDERKVPVKELPRPQHLADEADLMKLDCTKCGAKKSCWQERECPNCHAYFVPQSQIAHWEAVRVGRGDPGGVRDVCPKCGTDINKWYMEHKPK